jgi:hypothetical protein
MMVKRDTIMDVGDEFTGEMRQTLGKKFLEKLSDKKLTTPEILAIRDTKLVEAICLYLINKKMITVQNRPSVSFNP